MKNFTFLLYFFIFHSVLADDWGKTGHRVVAEIASNFLTEKTKVIIDDILEGQNLAYVSNYADEIKSDSNYNKYYPWHYVNIPFDKQYNDIEPSKEGDVIFAIRYFIKELKDSNTSNENKAFSLKFLVHLVGDIHQPCHVGKQDDKGGNLYYLKWFGKKSNLHRIWDTEMISNNGMSYTELSQNLINLYSGKLDKQEIIMSKPIIWLNESQNELKEIYNHLGTETSLGYSYQYKNFPLVEKKLYYAGIRLAFILNDIFDS